MATSPTSTDRQGAALDPLSHFVIMPILFITFVVAIYYAAQAHEHRLLLLWLCVVVLALILLNVKTRLYSLRVQDRVIRLEEHLRLARLLPAADLSRAAQLTTRQLIALRFASDAELPGLVERTLAESLAPPQIKAAIASWRPDRARI